MITIKVPCSTSNLGPGFDCLGLSLDLYNTFHVEEASSFLVTGCEERFQNEDNLFLQAYKQTFEGSPIPIHVDFDCEIPVSRGLGSSSTLTVGGIVAGYCIQKKPLNKEELLQIATRIEHHPDNAAPCIYGGLCASLVNEDKVKTYQLPLSSSLIFTVIIPDYEVSTQQARSVLPDTYSRDILVHSTSSALLLPHALESADLDLLIQVSHDQIHTPYRKQLLKDYDALSDKTSSYTKGAFFISGSGSTCIFISKEVLPEDFKQSLPSSWIVKQVHPTEEGFLVKEE